MLLLGDWASDKWASESPETRIGRQILGDRARVVCACSRFVTLEQRLRVRPLEGNGSHP